MRTVTLANVSPLPRRHWGVLTLPTDLAGALGNEATFVADDGRRWRAVRGSTKGCRTVYRVRTQIDGNELVTGQIVPEAHPDAGALVPHRWVSDNVQALLPKLGVRVQDGLGHRDYWTEESLALELIEQTAAHHRWRLLQRIPELGVYFEWWADVLHDDPVLHVFGKMVWSHRADPRPNRTFQFVAVRSGELIVFDYMTRHGGGEPMAMPGGGWMRVLNREPLNLQDGAGLPFSGAMLSFVSGSLGTPADPSQGDADLANLLAAARGPVLGVSHEWNGHFMANRWTPRFRASRPRDNLGWQVFLQRMLSVASWTAPREFGSSMLPAGTGDQEDFGATKGTEAVTQFDPRFIYRLRYSVQAEILRGVEHYEDSGKPLRAQDHPSWVTWSGLTHWHTGVSPDRLGKSTPPVPAGTGFVPHDDQHRSHNNLAAYIALSDDPFADDLVRHLATIDEAAYRVKFPASGVDAARAQGRTAQALAQLASIVDQDTAARLLAVTNARLAPINANPTLHVAGSMKVLAYGTPDSRKAVFNPDGTRGRWVSLWEHGLALVGLYVNWKQTQHPALLQTIRTVAATVARFGCFLHEPSGQPAQWWTVSDVLWTDGEAPAAGVVAGSNAIVAAPDAGGVRSWTFAGLLVAREVLGPAHELATKLAAYTDAVTGRIESDNPRTAEWWAAVATVAF